MSQIVDAVIVGAVRTPIGKGKAGHAAEGGAGQIVGAGGLNGVHSVDMLAHSLKALVEQTGIDPALVDDVITGNVTQADEQGQNISRNAVLAAGFPESVPATTVNRQCGSSQQAISFAAQAVMSGVQDVVIAAGVESMSRVPMMSDVRPGSNPFGEALLQRYPEGFIPQGYSAELIAADWGFSRTELDEFAISSHDKATAATKAGRFDNEIVPLAGLTSDEMIRPGGTVEKLATLKPAFYNPAMKERFPQIDWRITAANSSPLSDGSAAVLIMSSAKAKELGLRPLARLHSFSVVGSDPIYMLTGVIPATQKVLARAGLSISDIDLFEVNEAFSPVVLAWAKDTGADLSKTNVNGGAIALGHPLGASGARIMTTLVNALEQTGGRYGLQTMCEAGGLANATIIERL
ncbi:MAG: acetyl-CoA C-acyltransferase [Gordonia sp.]|nr:acetyl-CoA C-acyltransferase [Gordonia sp. (in: high G+C Gram-positive bacteria)]